SLSKAVDELLEKSTRLDSVEGRLSSLQEDESTIELLSSLNLDVELLSGYSTLNSFIGTISGNFSDIELELQDGAIEGLFFQGSINASKVIALFVKAEQSNDAQSLLNQLGFQAINIPEGISGDPNQLIVDLRSQISELMAEKSSISNDIESWSNEYGSSLACGLELLEREHDILTAPVKLAVSEHAFFVDGWIELSRSEEVQSALTKSCLYSEVTPFKIEAGGGGHGHSDHHHHQEMPPISYKDRMLSKPMELLTDAVGRPAYGRIDPTLFMFVTYPIFFGMMLGDMAYGLVTIALGAFVFSKANTNEMVRLGGKFLIYIGLGTLTFGYIYAEFAGWEIFMYEKTKIDGVYVYGDNLSPVAFLANLYPLSDSAHGYGPELELGFGINLYFPFHRVGTHLEDLIVLTIYVGFIHIIFGKLIGFRDVLFYGTDHGHVGLAAAFFEHGAWIVLLVGGFMFTYGFLGPEDAEYLLQPGAAIALSAVVMLIWTLYNYHGIPIAVSLILAPIEAIGMMPSVISYVRLFAVGIVGVKIAETGNKLWEPMMDADLLLVPFFFIGWLSVQIFAWVLGVFSPNIHAARLHFVEWMRQYYDSSGEAFEPFGFRSHFVEVE
ncbi:MAG: V-type ATPase 116kDa subunit family protein, partial [Candidatus Thalassarchaeaceae archaeon]|nr:V-type ATPase 116kDa subunit family protein [Candidatus Thalassarchaeaceae archaeon]